MKLKPHKVMAPDEYARMPIIGWHCVHRNIDGCGGVGVRFGLPEFYETECEQTAGAKPGANDGTNRLSD